MRIHADDCEANSRCCAWRYKTNGYSGVSCDGESHACDCSAQADLAELVAAAESAIKKEALCLDWLDKALKPFRVEKPKGS